MGAPASKPLEVEEAAEAELEGKIRPNRELGLLLKRWCEVIAQISKADPLSRRFFIDTAPVALEGSHLTVGVDAEFAAELGQLSNPRTQLVMGQAMRKVIGRPCSVTFRVLTPEDPRPLPADHLVSPVDGDATQQLTGVQKWYANPVVKMVVEAFNGEISDIRE